MQSRNNFLVVLIFVILVRCNYCHKSAWRPVDYRRDDHQYDQPQEYITDEELHHFHHQPQRAHLHYKTPQEAVVDVVNELGLKLLAIHNEGNENNIAISPYGAVSVLVALGEGLAGDAVEEIQHAAQLPHDPSVIRVGLRDIHRHLKSYFVPKEGFLAGLTLNHENVTLNKEYEEILRFYGYDTDSFNNALYPDPYTTQNPSITTTVPPELVTLNKKEGGAELTTTALPSTTEAETTTIENTTIVTTESTTTSLPSTTIETTIGTTTTTTIETTITTEAPTTITTTTTTTETPSSTTEKTTTLTTTIVPETTTPVLTTTQQAETVTKLNETEAVPTETTEQNAASNLASAEPPLTTTTELMTTVPTTTELSTIVPTTTELTTIVPTTPSEKPDFDIFDTTIVETTTQAYAPELFNQNDNFTNVYSDDFLTTSTFAYDSTTQNLAESSTNINNNFQNYYDYNEYNVATSSENSALSTTGQFLGQSGENVSNNEISLENFYPTDEQAIAETTTNPNNNKKRKTRSVVDYIIARYYDENPRVYQRERRPYLPEPQPSFLINGKYKEHDINFMTYDTVLPFNFIPHLNALALSFPLDSSKYYLLLLLPVDEEGIDQLICDLRLNASLKYIIQSLKYTHVTAIIPSFTLKGYVILTPTLQKLGIRRVFEPRQADFSPMTHEKGVYVTNIEQAVTVTIRNYVDPATMNNHHRNLHQYDPVIFKADHPFLYFVIDSEIHVTLMAGKIVNPLNTRVR